MARWLRMIGLGVVLTAAAVLSFAALRELAVAVSIDTRLAFLLPIAVDAGAAVSCTVWLSPTVQRDARRFACWLTWLLLGATVVGNAAQLGMHANHVVPPWWVAVLVGAIPPAVVGGVVHLLVLVNRGEVAKPATTPKLRQRRDDVTPAVADTNQSKTRAAVPTSGIDMGKARELIADGAGRVVLQKELGVTEHTAKQLVKSLTVNGHQP
jgi:uncharacterized protein DUF2637